MRWLFVLRCVFGLLFAGGRGTDEEGVDGVFQFVHVVGLFVE